MEYLIFPVHRSKYMFLEKNQEHMRLKFNRVKWQEIMHLVEN